MFGLFKKQNSSEPYFPFTTDIHSHILPGIDDGSPDVATSIELVKGLKNLGINKSVATPHIIGDMFPNNAETISKAKDFLQQELNNQNIEFELSAAAEYMLDSFFLDLLKKNEKLLTIKDNIILTEFSYSSAPQHVEEIIFEIITNGYSPILAHPERYGFAHSNYKIYHRWAELGFLLQVNLLSLTGYYGKEVAKAANYLLKNNLISYAGTDLHHARHMGALSHPKNQQIFKDAMSHRDWNIFS